VIETDPAQAQGGFLFASRLSDDFGILNWPSSAA